MKQHPAEMKRVTVATVGAELETAGVEPVRIREVQRGIVRVDVHGWTRAARRRARHEVCKALAPLKFREGWTVHPISMTYRWRPWCSWVTVRDAGFDWYDEHGLNFIEASTDDAH
jgi:hypothetical protein